MDGASDLFNYTKGYGFNSIRDWEFLFGQCFQQNGFFICLNICVLIMHVLFLQHPSIGQAQRIEKVLKRTCQKWVEIMMVQTTLTTFKFRVSMKNFWGFNSFDSLQIFTFSTQLAQRWEDVMWVPLKPLHERLHVAFNLPGQEESFLRVFALRSFLIFNTEWQLFSTVFGNYSK